MPELPEVEAIKIQLERFLVGHRIIKVEVLWKNSFSGDTKLILNSRIKKVRRYAKVLVLDFENNNSLVIQIKLTGQLIYKGPNLKIDLPLSEKVKGGVMGKHTHVVFTLDKKGMLYYLDVRKFGRLKALKTSEVSANSLIGRLGPEPFRDLTQDTFEGILSKSKTPIKILLMDQTKVSGIGNIYANDALWLAKINPKKLSNNLCKNEISKLFESVEFVLKEGIKRGGASELSFVTPDGLEGTYQKHFLIYDQEGSLCKSCKKAKIKKIKMGGRGTYFCPVCQK